MSGMVLRFDRTEGVVRNLGDPPNGALVVGREDDGSFALGISASFDPARQGIHTPAGTSTLIDAGGRDDFVAVPLADLVAGCAGPLEASSLWDAACLLVAQCVNALPGTMNVEAVADALRVTAELRAELAAAGFLARPEEGDESPS